ncbi:hypothetical protein DPMN_186088 [Dreissena polymorpha]|uniref:Uncharacterized protein n=1 Tax=Dreissena polymorpha TaxID=45954 RepID=A0A9D4I9A6_DREPO|nr:hypothetical protein DPMN_186088 [Dreissena polymorpha]
MSLSGLRVAWQPVGLINQWGDSYGLQEVYEGITGDIVQLGKAKCIRTGKGLISTEKQWVLLRFKDGTTQRAPYGTEERRNQRKLRECHDVGFGGEQLAITWWYSEQSNRNQQQKRADQVPACSQKKHTIDRYKPLLNDCRQQGWKIWNLHVVIGSRGCAGRSLWKAYGVLSISGMTMRRVIADICRQE